MQYIEYLGFSIHRIGLRRYFVIGPGFRGCAASVAEAVKMIYGITAGQCEELTARGK